MKLEVNDAVIENATAEDVHRAFTSLKRGEEVFIGLTLDEANAIDAEWIEGSFQVTLTENDKFHDAGRPLDADETRDLFARYLTRDERWRDVATWTAWPEPSASAPATIGGAQGMPAFLKNLPPWAIAVVVLPLMFVIPMLIDVIVGFFERIRLPSWMDSTPARIALGFFAVVVAMFLVATIVKVREVKRAAGWSKTSGRIIRSKEGFDVVQRDSEKMPTNERTADIVYEYQVADRTFQASRITFAERIGPEEIPDLLKRYPEGRSVEVYYDPANPKEAVLDRTMDGLARGCLVMLAFGVAAIVALMVAVTKGPAIVQQGLPNAIVPMVAISGFGALIVSLAGWSIVKTAFAARNWPKTAGRVTLSEVHGYETIDRNTSSSSSHRPTRRRQGFMPIVEYEYAVAGRTYTSRHVKLDTEVGGSQSFAEGVNAKYPVGRIVTVRYDPKDPKRAYLELSMTMGWIMIALAALLILATVWSAGLLTEGPPLKMGRRT